EAGQPVVRVFQGNTGIPVAGVMGTGLQVFASSLPGGGYVATGNLTGTVTPWGERLQQIIVGGVVNGVPQILTFDGISGAALNTIQVFDPSYRGGVRVGAVDIDDDGDFEILSSSGQTGSTNELIYDATTGAVVRQFAATTGNRGVFSAGGSADTSPWD